jgi:hypothetical protein
VINAKDDEPQWVRDYYHKALQRGLAAIGIGVVFVFVGGNLFSGLRGIFFLCGFIPLAVFGWWMHRAYPPVRAWKEAWIKEHQSRNREDSQHP